MADLQSTLLEAYMTRKMALESALSNLGTEDQELVQEFFKLFEDVHATLSGCIVDCHKGITIQNQYGPAENGHDNKVESPRRLIPELSSAEFEKIPRYVKDRVPYDAMKPFIDQLEVIINKKYLLLSKPRAQVSRQDMEKVKEFRSQEKDETRDDEHCSRSCPSLPPGTQCVDLCGDGCPTGTGCCSHQVQGCGPLDKAWTCQPLSEVPGYGDQCPKHSTDKNGDDLSYSSDSYPDRWCSNKCKAGEVCAEFVDGELGCVRGEENACARTSCPFGTTCRLQKAICLSPPCYPIARCLP
ncbi:uncharacterized protein LOC136029257 isoform X2 [Artemia franciscana]|uniref:uncharacterized protein LOC136029257 isoform X2 n=1 Tax=Artemia franciscana TaxID=6661 RepID=UPI0032DBAB34